MQQGLPTVAELAGWVSHWKTGKDMAAGQGGSFLYDSIEAYSILGTIAFPNKILLILPYIALYNPIQPYINPKK